MMPLPLSGVVGLMGLFRGLRKLAPGYSPESLRDRLEAGCACFVALDVSHTRLQSFISTG